MLPAGFGPALPDAVGEAAAGELVDPAPCRLRRILRQGVEGKEAALGNLPVAGTGGCLLESADGEEGDVVAQARLLVLVEAEEFGPRRRTILPSSISSRPSARSAVSPGSTPPPGRYHPGT